MAGPRELVNELRAKISFLRTDPVARGKGGHNSQSAKSFYDATGIGKGPFERACGSEGIEGDDRLGLEHQQRIATKLGFWDAKECKVWQEFSDPTCRLPVGNPERPDSAAKFEKRYRDSHVAVGTEHPAPSPEQGPRRTDAHLVEDDAWVFDHRFETPFCSLSVMWSSQINANAKAGQAFLSFRMNCPDYEIEGLRTGLRAGILKFDCGTARTTDFKDRTGYPEGVSVNAARVTPYGVDLNKPTFRVEAIREGKPIGIVADAVGAFIQVDALASDDIVSAAFVAYVGEVQTTFVVPEGVKSSVARSKIKKRLVEKHILAVEDGVAVLACAGVKLIEKGSK